MPIPDFRGDGYLPEGVHQATEPEVLFRFGSPTRRRRILALRLRDWLEQARAIGAARFLVDGSFVTSKPRPGDLDAVLQLPPGFDQQVQAGSQPVLDFYETWMVRQPEDFFVAQDDSDWLLWVEFFTRTREADRRRKGVVEIAL